MSETEEVAVQIEYEWINTVRQLGVRDVRNFVCLYCGGAVAETDEIPGRVRHTEWHQKYANLHRAVEMGIEASTQMVGILERLTRQVEVLSKSSSTIMRKLLGR